MVSRCGIHSAIRIKGKVNLILEIVLGYVSLYYVRKPHVDWKILLAAALTKSSVSNPNYESITKPNLRRFISFELCIISRQALLISHRQFERGVQSERISALGSR